MIRNYYNEKWQEFSLGYESQKRYAISTYGRLVSFIDKIKDGDVLKGSTASGYRTFRYKIVANKKVINKNLLLHRIMAEQFLPKESEEQKFVIHLDFDKTNNRLENLKWATKEESEAHNKKNPDVVQAIDNMVKDIHAGKRHKLNPSKVLFIREKLDNPNRKTRMKMLAKQFDVSEMQLYRIKRRENWGHLKD
ncbi:MAG: HNH endonuclease [Arcicella sp.]|nr:HNH endonuclease [Arcicella sp.]